VLGLSTQKVFREPQATVNKKELSSYKIVQEEEFVFVPTTDTWKVFFFFFNKGNGTIVVSPIYEVFATDRRNLLPEYLAIWLRRAEFDRYARYHSWGSARENFMFSDLCEVEIPIPDIRIQYSIVSIYNTYIERRELNETLKTRIRDICPILIKGSLEDAEAIA
jgi:type I restriction enzyme S subunit